MPRSAATGKYVGKDFAKKNKKTTVNESKGADTKRLDWVIESKAELVRGIVWRVTWFDSERSPGPQFTEDADLRTALDAAMKQ